MRGAHADGHRLDQPAGIIPADAGSTRSSSSLVSSYGDHPRGCGEHQQGRFLPRLPVGSSPRMRGAPGPGMNECSGQGIIPADAGSTRHGNHFLRMEKDHPRGCGEHLLNVPYFGLKQGSSPRMRGAQKVPANMPLVVGIIPADAGSTLQQIQIAAQDKDHPRGCGEHRGNLGGRYRKPGSSPRMRGALRVANKNDLRLRIIPADAGSTRRTGGKHNTKRDHPRGCGEHNPSMSLPVAIRGSSPRMRGAQTFLRRSHAH